MRFVVVNGDNVCEFVTYDEAARFIEDNKLIVEEASTYNYNTRDGETIQMVFVK